MMRSLAEFFRKKAPREATNQPKLAPAMKRGAAHHLRVRALTSAMRGAANAVVIGGTAAAVGIAPGVAAAEALRAQLELLEAHIELRAEVVGGVLTVEVSIGQSGIFSLGTRGRATVDLHGLLAYEQIAALEGCTYEAEFDGALKGGIFEGTRTETSTCPASAPMPIDVNGLLGQISRGVPTSDLQVVVVSGTAQPTPCGSPKPKPHCSPRCPLPPTRPTAIPKQPDAFPEDPDTPAVFTLNFSVVATNLKDHPSGYRVVHGPLPIPGLRQKIVRIPQSGEVEVEFERGEEGKPGYARWRLKGTATPGEGEVRGTFERVDVPARGNDLTGPSEFKVGVRILDKPNTSGCTVELVPDAKTPDALRGRVHCAVVEEIPGLQPKSVLAVWEERGDGTPHGAQTGRAYRAVLTPEQRAQAQKDVVPVTMRQY